MSSINTTLWERSSEENWQSPSSDSLKMLVNLNHDYIVSDVEFANYTLVSDVTTLQGDDDGIGVVFDYIDGNNYKYIMYQGGGLGNAIYLDHEGNRSAIVLVEVVNGVHKTIVMNTYASFWNVNTTFNIRLENIFDDVFFYVNGTLLLKYKKENSMSGKIGFVTYSQIADFNNIAIEEPLVNRVKTKYVLFAVGDSDVLTEIEASVGVDSDVETEIIPRALGIVDKDVFLDVKYRGNLDALVEIQPIGHHNMPTEIEVRPHNRMTAIYEVQQPPIVTDVFNPTQDSFTRESKAFETINYGRNSSMVAGISQDEIWRSFVQFDVSSINPSYILTESYLRLYYKGAVPTNVKLEIYNNDEAWLEYSITNLNRPNPIELITNEFTVNTDYGYIEFDVLSVVEDWVAQRIINNGFLVRVSNETELGQATFHTRETMFPPELVVKYYDSRIFSQGRSQFLTEIFIMKRDDSDVLVVIEPSSIFSNNNIETEIYCHQVDVPLDSDVLVELIANIPITNAEITASLRGEIEAWVTIDARLPNDNSVDAEISVNRDKANAEITPAFRDSIEGDIEIIVSVPCIYTEISVYDYGENETLAEIEINTIFISRHYAEITVSKEALDIEVTPKVKGKQDVYAVISVSRVKVETEVEVKHRSDIWVEIEPNIKSDILVSITANIPDTMAEINVFGYEKLEELAEIDIRVFSQIEAEIYVPHRSELEVEIDAKSVSQTYVEITINKPYVHSQIVIPTWVDQYQLAEIQPRILMVSNVYTVIQVGSAGGAYAFII